LPCSSAADCCSKEDQDLLAFRRKDFGEAQVPGLRLDLPIADPSRSSRQAAGTSPGGTKPQDRKRSRDHPETAPPGTLPPGDNDNDSQDFFVLPPGDPNSDDERVGHPAAESGESRRPNTPVQALDGVHGASNEEVPLEPQGEKEAQALGAAMRPTATARAEATAAEPRSDEEPRARLAEDQKSEAPAASSAALGAGSSAAGPGTGSTVPEAQVPGRDDARDWLARSVQQGGLVLGFGLPDGSERLVNFGRRKPPMGMDFAKDVPVRVYSVKQGGHAAELGIQTGWQVVSINSQNVRGCGFMEVMQKLAAAALEKPETPRGQSGEEPLVQSGGGGGLVLGFALPEGIQKIVDFGSRKPPLGMDFSKAIPIRVKRIRPGGHGQALGICEGWEVTSVNGVSIQGKSVMEVFNMMKAATAASGAA